MLHREKAVNQNKFIPLSWLFSRPSFPNPQLRLIGVFPDLCVAGLGMLGHNSTVSLVYGLVLQGVVILPPLILWLFDLGLERVR